MKTFLQHAKEKNWDLSIDENRVRTGIHTAMPKGYVRSQYPDAYFYPYIGTAPLDLKHLDQDVKDKAPPDDAP